MTVLEHRTTLSPRRPNLPPLFRNELPQSPYPQFHLWWERAAAEVPLWNAMTLATVDSDGAPDARTVLLTGHGPDGLRFFTNYDSAKGRQLAADARAAVVLYWRELDRQVRARGTIEPLSDADSDEYFAGRPHDAQLGAMASPQSTPLASRAELEARLREVTVRFEGESVPRPTHWGGYLLVPEEVEFWQGSADGVQDRFRYRRAPQSWVVERLAP